MLNRGETDFAIVGDLSEDVDDRRFLVSELGKDWLVLITPMNHPLANKDEVFLEDVIQYPMIFLTEDYGITTSIKKALKESGIDEEPKSSLTVGDFFSKLNSVSSNLGIAITSLIAASKAYEVGLVKVRSIKGFKSERSIYLVTSTLSTECMRMKEYHSFIVENSRRLFENYRNIYNNLQ